MHDVAALFSQLNVTWNYDQQIAMVLINRTVFFFQEASPHRTYMMRKKKQMYDNCALRDVC